MNYTAIVDSPLGDLSLLSDGEALTGLTFPKWRHVPEGFREGTVITGVSGLLFGADLALAYILNKRRKKVQPCGPSNA